MSFVIVEEHLYFSDGATSRSVLGIVCYSHCTMSLLSKGRPLFVSRRHRCWYPMVLRAGSREYCSPYSLLFSNVTNVAI